MKNPFALFITILLLLCSPAFSQHRHTFICSYYGEPINGPLKTFSSSDDAKKVIGNIMDVIGLQSTFQIRSANIPNAAAVISSGQRYVLYNPVFINAVNDAAQDKWAAIAILAHEIGHHLNGHTLSSTGSRPHVELEADQFSGFVLRKMGATLEQSQKAMQLIGSKRASLTHPAREDRLSSIATGWKKANAQMAGVKYKEPEIVKTESPSLPKPTANSPSILSSKYIKHTVVFNSIREKFYITTRNNLVTFQNDRLVVLGKLQPTGNSNYPWSIITANIEMYITSRNVIIDSRGNRLGYFT